MTDRELMQQALEALEDACGGRCNAEYNPCWQRNVADALRERLAQPEQEPNYWLGYGLQAHTEKPFEGATPLYTAQPQGISYTPPQRKPLTDEEIARACVPLGWAILSFTEVARAIEAAHGIKGQA